MFHVKRITIEGFWGKYSVATDLSPDVNVFIGRNGTGKTTLMNLLQGVLRVDLQVLATLEFTRITIALKDKAKTRTITATKQRPPQSPFESLSYSVARKQYKLPLIARDLEYRTFGRTSPFQEEYHAVKREIEELVSISSLSVHRAPPEPIYEDEYRRRVRDTKTPIDQRLDELMNGLTRYQVALEKRSSEVSARFEKQVLASILYDPKFDKVNFTESLRVQLDKEKDALSRAFRELGAFDPKIGDQIDDHVAIINAGLKKIWDISRKPNAGTITLDDIAVFPLLKRTQHIVELSLATDTQKQQISQPIQLFLEILHEFMQDKQVRISSEGVLLLSLDDKLIQVTDLSSGEKQLLILLTETLLEKNEPFVFLADEPELSLHIEWQAKVIPAIKRLNSCSQVIVATHSPEIAASTPERIIDMEDIISG